MSGEPLPTATRQIKLRFDEKGDPAFSSVKGPESFKQHARGILPPPDVIPVIFIPGVMGSNIRQIKGKKKVWAPPNGKVSGIGAGISGAWGSAKGNHSLFDVDNTEVDPTGPCVVNINNYWLDKEEARIRKWGTLHADSYHAFLDKLEEQLNEQYIEPGVKDSPLISQIGMLEYLSGGASKTEDCHAFGPKRKPDYASHAQEAMKAWEAQPKALTKNEIKRLGDYYFPVWAFGYNWLRSLEEAASELIDYINNTVFKRYEGKYFRHQNKVIFITHSMGGLVGRRAAQMAPDKVLGVVHGVQPVMGAPLLYRRYRSGIETNGFFDIPGFVFSHVAGSNEKKVAAQIATAPGPLQLAPTCDHEPDWLKIVFETKTLKESSGIFNPAVKQQGDVIFTAPKTDPYTEIYSKTTDDCWWGLVNPVNLDLSGRFKKDGLNPLKIYQSVVQEAKRFHSTLKKYAHPMTYGFYGNDDDKYRTFGHVTWEIPELKGCALRPEQLAYVQATEFSSGAVKLSVPFYDTNDRSVYVGTVAKTVEAKLSNKRNQSGDGTVSLHSGAWLEKLEPKPQEVFTFPGFDHQGAYNYRYAAELTIYFIARITQKAKPV